MRAHILVTGAAGRIGQAFITAHRDRFEFTGVDRKPTPNVDHSVTADLADLDALTKAATGCQALVHLGAHTNHHPDYPGMIVTNNVIGTYHAFEAAARAGVKRIVFASTVQTEFGWGEGVKVSVSMPAKPTNFYSSSKLFGEHLGFLYSRDRGVSVICLRIGGVIPPEQEEELILSGSPPADIGLLSWDAVEILKRAVEVQDVAYAVVPAYSINADAIKDLEPLKRILGFVPQRDPRLMGVTPEEQEIRQRGRKLLEAAGRGELEAVRTLLDAEPGLLETVGRGSGWEDRKMRPLHQAARHGHLPVLELLLTRGADVSATGGRHGWTPVQLAAIHKHPETAKKLLEHGATRDIFTASGLAETDAVATLLAADPASARATTLTGVTPLHVAGSPAVLELLLRHGADPGARDDWRRTPLNWAQERPAVARALAERLGALDIFTATMLNDGALADRLLAADPLLANAVSPTDGQFWPGRRPLHFAVMRGHLDMIRRLIAAGADVNVPDPEGGTPLHMAAWHGKLDVIRLLAGAGARIGARDSDWSATPRDWAEHAKQTEAVALLDALEKERPAQGADPVRPVRTVLVTGLSSPAGKAFRAAASGLELRSVDALDAASLEKAAAGVDAIVHLGGAPSTAAFPELLAQDVLGTWSVLEAAHHANVARMVFGSTPDVFSGWTAGTDRDPGKTPLRPGSLWAAVKALNENLCAAYGKRLPTPIVSVRLSDGDPQAGAKLLATLEGSQS